MTLPNPTTPWPGCLRRDWRGTRSVEGDAANGRVRGAHIGVNVPAEQKLNLPKPV